MTSISLHQCGESLVAQLAQQRRRLVLAESCTGGLVAATMATVPGVSEWWCGSAVTYREDTKVRWIDVREHSLKTHTAVSESVAQEMAKGVLNRTPESHIAGAITGHLGPNAPTDQDGLVFIGVATASECVVTGHRLESSARSDRQKEAACLVLIQLTHFLKKESSDER
ncbi:MAG: nicotinamide-nucleotide amidohydrolase family protein [Planctomycetota bacterium]